MARKVEFFRTPSRWYRWDARTVDSTGAPVNGVGFTKRAALSHLQHRLRQREEWRARESAAVSPASVIEVDW